MVLAAKKYTLKKIKVNKYTDEPNSSMRTINTHQLTAHTAGANGLRDLVPQLTLICIGWCPSESILVRLSRVDFPYHLNKLCFQPAAECKVQRLHEVL